METNATQFDRLCFIHIPKTAGTSVTRTLAKFYPETLVFPGVTMIDYRLYSKQQLLNFTFYKGHIPIRHGLSMLDEKTRYVTLLRDPIKRILSLYFFWKYKDETKPKTTNQKDAVNDGPQYAKELDLISFLESDEPFLQKATTNVQLQYLSSYNWNEFLNLPTSVIREDINRNIKHFSLIGIQDNLDLFMQQLKRLTGFNLPNKLKHHNSSESEHYFAELPNQTQTKAIELISEKNATEIQLYKEIKQRCLNNI